MGSAARLSASSGKGRLGVFSKTGRQGDERLKRPISSRIDCHSDAFLAKCSDYAYLQEGTPEDVVPEGHAAPLRPSFEGECIRLVDGRALVLLPDGAKREIAPDG